MKRWMLAVVAAAGCGGGGGGDSESSAPFLAAGVIITDAQGQGETLAGGRTIRLTVRDEVTSRPVPDDVIPFATDGDRVLALDPTPWYAGFITGNIDDGSLEVLTAALDAVARTAPSGTTESLKVVVTRLELLSRLIDIIRAVTTVHHDQVTLEQLQPTALEHFDWLRPQAEENFRDSILAIPAYVVAGGVLGALGGSLVGGVGAVPGAGAGATTGAAAGATNAALHLAQYLVALTEPYWIAGMVAGYQALLPPGTIFDVFSFVFQSLPVILIQPRFTIDAWFGSGALSGSIGGTDQACYVELSSFSTGYSYAAHFAGAYSFFMVPNGDYRLKVSRSGYRKVDLPISVVGAMTQDITLQPIPPVELVVSSTFVDFGAATTTLDLAVYNRGSGSAAWWVSETLPWLATTVLPVTGSHPDDRVVRLAVDRSGLSPETYAGQLVITDGATQYLAVAIIMTVPAAPASGGTGSAIQAPSVTSPAWGSAWSMSGVPPTFSWSTISGALAYVFQEDIDPNFTSNGGNGGWYGSVGGTSVSIPISFWSTVPAGTHYFRVRAQVNGIPGPWSATLTYAVTSGAVILGAPALSIPSNGSTLGTAQPTFSWNAVSGANAYQMQVGNNSTSWTVNTIFFESTTINTSETPASSLVPQGYAWRVRASGDAGATWGPWSAVRTFTIQPTGAPTLLSPANGATFSGYSITFTWQAVAGAPQYQFAISNTSAAFQPVMGEVSFMTVTPGTSATTWTSGNFMGGANYWAVRVVYPNQYGPWSEVRKVVVP